MTAIGISGGWIAFGLAALLAAGCWPAAQMVRHPDHRPLAAYLVFVSVFALSAAALFTAIIAVARAAGLLEAMSGGGAAALILIVILIPAFFAARWVVRRPPMRRRPR